MDNPAQLFGVNTYAYTMTHGAAACVEHLAAKGFRAFELMLYPGHLWPAVDGATARTALRRRIEAQGLRLITLNMPNIDINIAAAAPQMRAYSLDILAQTVDLAGDLGAEAVILGPGKPNPLFPAPAKQFMGHFHAALDRLAPQAAARGTALWVENMPFAFLPDADGLMAALDAYGNDAIGVCYDIANGYFIDEDPCEGLRRVRSRLKLVHASDTGRTAFRHDPVGWGSVPFAAVPPVLKEIGYRELPVLEIISNNPDRDIDASARRLVELGWGDIAPPANA